MQTELNKIASDWCAVLRFFYVLPFNMFIGKHIQARTLYSKIK
nr:MAG TPA: hypothetical protein [Caudoviricetes sp.]